jgi:hypothetical protein
MLGVVNKFISNICSKSPPKLSEFIGTKANISIIMVVEKESTKNQPVDI